MPSPRPGLPFLVREKPQNVGDYKRTGYGGSMVPASAAPPVSLRKRATARTVPLTSQSNLPEPHPDSSVSTRSIWLLLGEMDAAGTMSLAITADSAISNACGFQLNVLAPGSLRLTAFTIHPDALLAGEAANCIKKKERGGGGRKPFREPAAWVLHSPSAIRRNHSRKKKNDSHSDILQAECFYSYPSPPVPASVRLTAVLEATR